MIRRFGSRPSFPMLACVATQAQLTTHKMRVSSISQMSQADLECNDGIETYSPSSEYATSSQTTRALPPASSPVVNALQNRIPLPPLEVFSESHMVQWRSNRFFGRENQELQFLVNRGVFDWIAKQHWGRKLSGDAAVTPEAAVISPPSDFNGGIICWYQQYLVALSLPGMPKRSEKFVADFVGARHRLHLLISKLESSYDKSKEDKSLPQDLVELYPTCRQYRVFPFRSVAVAAHAAFAAQCAMAVHSGRAPDSQIDPLLYVRHHMSSDLLYQHLFKSRGSSAVSVLKALLAPGTQFTQCSVDDLCGPGMIVSNLDAFGPALVSNWGTVLDRPVPPLIGSPDDRIASRISVVLLGSRTEGDHTFFLVQNWAAGWDEFIEVRSDYFLSCLQADENAPSGGTVMWATTPL